LPGTARSMRRSAALCHNAATWPTPTFGRVISDRR
jgi:hypothetical protein